MESEECVALLQGDHPFPEQRQIVCGMMMQLDDGVGRVSDRVLEKRIEVTFVVCTRTCNIAFIFLGCTVTLSSHYALAGSIDKIVG